MILLSGTIRSSSFGNTIAQPEPETEAQPSAASTPDNHVPLFCPASPSASSSSIPSPSSSSSSSSLSGLSASGESDSNPDSNSDKTMCDSSNESGHDPDFVQLNSSSESDSPIDPRDSPLAKGVERCEGTASQSGRGSGSQSNALYLTDSGDDLPLNAQSKLNQTVRKVRTRKTGGRCLFKSPNSEGQKAHLTNEERYVRQKSNSRTQLGGFIDATLRELEEIEDLNHAYRNENTLLLLQHKKCLLKIKNLQETMARYKARLSKEELNYDGN